METPNQNWQNLSPEEIVRIIFISLFAGGGGSSWGYRKAGLIEALAVEWDKHAKETFELNFPDVPIIQADILKLSSSEILTFLGIKKGELHLFDASPPCQDFAGCNTKPDLDSDNIKLYFKTLDLIDELAPMMCVIENVEGMMEGKKIPIFNKIVKKLKTLNYYWQYKVIHAEEYGVPQARKRVIIIGLRMDIASQFNIKELFPKPDIENVPNMALGIVLPHLAAVSPGQFLDRIIYRNRPACTITKSVSLWVYELDGIRRRPTIEELKILSSFPPEFQFVGSFTEIWARIGNAVPPKITEAIGLHIRNNVLTQEVLK